MGTAKSHLPAVMQNKASPKKLRAASVILIWLGSLSLSTQFFAAKFGYHEALGWNFQHIYWPWQILIWAIKWLSDYQFMFMQAGSLGLTACSFLLILVALKQSLESSSATASDYLHGSARWAEEKDIKEAGITGAEGVYIGGYEDDQGNSHYLRHNGSEHVLCIAPTRSGKGICLVIPTLLSWRQSCVVTDLKGELWALTSGWRKEHAHNIVLRFEPATGNGSCRWNPLDEIRLETDYEISDAQNLATMIVDPDGKGLVDHWQKTAQALLVGAILHICYKRLRGKDVQASLAGIDLMLADPTCPNEELWKEMKTFKHRVGWVHPVVAQTGQDMSDRPEQERGSVLSSAKSYLSLYRDPVVAENTNSSDFKIKDLMFKNEVYNPEEKPLSLYIVTQPTDKERLRPLVRILINMICRLLAEKMEFSDTKAVPFKKLAKFFRILQGKSIAPVGGGRRGKSNYQHKLLMMMDEFPSLGKLGIVQESLAFLAGYGILFYIICQDITQLKSDDIGYGKDEAITSNCHIQSAFQPNRPETAEYISKLTGQTTVVKEQVTVSGQRMGMLNSVSKAFQEVSRPLMTVDECMRMAPPVKSGDSLIKGGEMLVYIAGYPAIRGRQMPYFLDPIFQARSIVDPPKVSDSLRQLVQVDSQVEGNQALAQVATEAENSQKLAPVDTAAENNQAENSQELVPVATEADSSREQSCA